MNKWIAEFELEDRDTMPEHMDLEYKGAKIDFHCRPMWIPCRERLPENDDKVLITHSHGVSMAWWNGRYWTGSMIKKYKTVTAWMPLPERYYGSE